MKEFTRYRAVYCGVCKALSERYGQVPRLSLTYDFTFFALLFLSLAADDAQISNESCILNPIQKKPVAKGHDVLDLTADCTVLLAGFQLQDDVVDEGTLKARLRSFLFSGAFKKAKQRLPELTTVIESRLAALRQDEASEATNDQGKTPLTYASHFAFVLEAMFSYAATRIELEPDLVAALALVGSDLGAWIYLIDALDDYTEDKEKGRFNPLGTDTFELAVELLAETFVALEASLDRILALLPYKRDGGIMRNIALEGLQDVRRTVAAGRKLGRL